jgi:predicted transcriptional regulator
MAIKRVQKKIAWSQADRERHKAIRETFKDKPTIEQLIERGELSGETMTLGAYISLRLLVGKLRELREQSKLSLSDVSEKSRMDKAMLSRLENGHVSNPGIETITRYLEALDKTLEWRVVDAASSPS